MPASRLIALPDRLNSRSNTGRAVRAGGRHIDHHVVGLAAAMKTSLCTCGTPGSRIAVFGDQRANRAGHGLAAQRCVCDPTIEGTCMRRPALTRRTRPIRVPVVPSRWAAVAANSEAERWSC